MSVLTTKASIELMQLSTHTHIYNVRVIFLGMAHGSGLGRVFLIPRPDLRFLPCYSDLARLINGSFF